MSKEGRALPAPSSHPWSKRSALPTRKDVANSRWVALCGPHPPTLQGPRVLSTGGIGCGAAPGRAGRGFGAPLDEHELSARGGERPSRPGAPPRLGGRGGGRERGEEGSKPGGPSTCSQSDRRSGDGHSDPAEVTVTAAGV